MKRHSRPEGDDEKTEENDHVGASGNQTEGQPKNNEWRSEPRMEAGRLGGRHGRYRPCQRGGGEDNFGRGGRGRYRVRRAGRHQRRERRLRSSHCLHEEPDKKDAASQRSNRRHQRRYPPRKIPGGPGSSIHTEWRRHHRVGVSRPNV